LLQVISDNIRFPQAAMGDLRSQIAPAPGGAKAGGTLQAYGTDTIAAAMEIIYRNRT